MVENEDGGEEYYEYYFDWEEDGFCVDALESLFE